MTKEIVDFLIRAKKATYAGKGGEDKSSRPNSHDLSYSEGELLYIDTYLGGAKFSGEEALWDNDVPFWSMNYVGRIISEGFDGDFLKEALLKVPQDKPFRGPEKFESNGYTYLCSVDGEIEWFNGYEAIYLDDKKIYECLFHGGLVK